MQLKDEKLFLPAMRILKKMEEEAQQLTNYLNIEQSLLLKLFPRTLVYHWHQVDDRDVNDFSQTFFEKCEGV